VKYNLVSMVWTMDSGGGQNNWSGLK